MPLNFRSWPGRRLFSDPPPLWPSTVDHRPSTRLSALCPLVAAYGVFAAGCAQPRGEPPAQLPAATAAASLPATESAKPAEVRLGTEWESLFDGASLRGWKITDFAGHGDVAVAQGEIRVDAGAALS